MSLRVAAIALAALMLTILGGALLCPEACLPGYVSDAEASRGDVLAACRIARQQWHRTGQPPTGPVPNSDRPERDAWRRVIDVFPISRDVVRIRSRGADGIERTGDDIWVDLSLSSPDGPVCGQIHEGLELYL